jgi:hypothetical protein
MSIRGRKGRAVLTFASAGAIGGLVVLGAGWTRRVDGASPRQLRWAPVLVFLAPVLFWVLVHRRLS